MKNRAHAVVHLIRPTLHAPPHVICASSASIMHNKLTSSVDLMDPRHDHPNAWGWPRRASSSQNILSRKHPMLCLPCPPSSQPLQTVFPPPLLQTPACFGVATSANVNQYVIGGLCVQNTSHAHIKHPTCTIHLQVCLSEIPGELAQLQHTWTLSYLTKQLVRC